jgi:heparan-alpha-glucosaminide N-acetyltransferase
MIDLILTFSIPVPCGTTVLRGKLAPNCNAAGYLDSLILTTNHMYRWPTCLDAVPPCEYFDPEGLLTTFNAVTSGFIGLYFGYTLTRFTNHTKRLAHWIPLSLFFIIMSIIMHFSGYHYNKNLYTFSYVFLMAGCSGLLLSICYAAIDIPKTRIPQYLMMPFIVLGMNSIAIYAIDEFFPMIFGSQSPNGGAWFFWQSKDQNLVYWFFKTFLLAFPMEWAVFFYALMDTILMITIAAIFYRQKKFFKI